MADPYYIENLKSGYAWPAGTVYFTFWTALPGYYSGADDEANGFQQFTAGMKDAARVILGQISTFANITFAETADTALADIGFAQARLPSGTDAWAYYPDEADIGDFAGDVWISTRNAENRAVDPGEYGFYVLMHEIGHALGLKHSFETPSLPDAEDTTQYTVMAYEEAAILPSTYALYDIAALQNLYGANMSYHSGDDNYALEAGRAYTIWDAGGSDKLDGAAIASNMILDLRAGHFSSVGGVNNISIAFNVTIEMATGGAGADTFYANDAGNLLNGGAGVNHYYGGAGNDFIDGTYGSDYVHLAGDFADFTFNVVDAWKIEAQSSATGLDTLLAAEFYVFDDQTWRDTALRALLDPNDHSNPQPMGLSMTGTAAKETLQGGLLGDMLRGMGGNDLLYGYEGDDIIDGGDGNDIAEGGEGADELKGEAGNDTLYGGGGADTVDGGIGNDKLYGGTHNDTLTGGAGNDAGMGGSGDDIIDGGDGNDTLMGEEGADDIAGGAGNDKIDGGWDNDILDGGAGNDVLTGGAGDDAMAGGEGNDKLSGGDGADTLAGGEGNDTLTGDMSDDILSGGTGKDKLTGGDGNDIFLFDTAPAKGNEDTITDFAAGDIVDIRALLTGYDPLTDALSDFVDVSAKGTTTTLKVDIDGALNGQLFVTVATLQKALFADEDAMVTAGALLVA